MNTPFEKLNNLGNGIQPFYYQYLYAPNTTIKERVIGEFLIGTDTSVFFVFVTRCVSGFFIVSEQPGCQ